MPIWFQLTNVWVADAGHNSPLGDQSGVIWPTARLEICATGGFQGTGSAPFTGGDLLKWVLTALALLALFAGIAALQRRQTPAQVTLGQMPAQVTVGHQRHEFTPVAFHNKFAASTTPVLRVSTGDTIHTTTIDAAGADERGVRRGEAGNPQTGPFHINGAEPGDTVAVHLTRLRLNRDWAISTDTLSNPAVTPELAARMGGQRNLVRWRLDIERGVATRENPPANLAHYAVPLKPMLGCIALAPPAADAVPDTGEFGVWGGNLDFNEIVEVPPCSFRSVFLEGSFTLAMHTQRKATGSSMAPASKLRWTWKFEWSFCVSIRLQHPA